MMFALVALLPLSWQPKAKSLIGLLGAVVAAVLVAFPEGPRWLLAAVAVLTTIGIYATPAPGYVYTPPAPAKVTP